jgi:hypothetical protein
MARDYLTFEQLSDLLSTVFAPGPDEGGLAILVDLPDARVPDHDRWVDRRRIAAEWFRTLSDRVAEVPFRAVVLYAYPNVGSNNNDLPDRLVLVEGREPLEAIGRLVRSPSGAALLGPSVPLAGVLGSSSVVLALTEMSATAPLKLLAKHHGFRGATLPGFMREMIPVLALDFDRVNARVLEFRERMDRASGIDVVLEVGAGEGGDAVRVFESHFDLRFRTGHASGGLMREPGMVGNLPSGEAYVVPYEGERDSEPSRTTGMLPVQFGDEVVVYRLERNRAVEVLSTGPASEAERQRLVEEPAYGNMAEVGIGVLGEWGIEPVGSTLLDEKLGLHIAFGRSDHFGGVTGPTAFSSRERVVHVDRVYVPSVQPLVAIREVVFAYPDGSREPVMRAGVFVV